MIDWLGFDTESNGFLREATKVHCISVCGRSGEPQLFVGDEAIRQALVLLDSAACIAAHNGIGHDLPLLKKLFDWTPKAFIVDTLMLSRLFWPDIESVGVKERHSIKSWGIRLRCYKGNYEEHMLAQGLDPWAEYNADMGLYCVKDAKVLRQLWFACEDERKKHDWETSIRLRHALAKLMHVQEQNGIAVDVPLAERTVATWRAKVASIDAQLEDAVPPAITRYDDAKNFRADGLPNVNAEKWVNKDTRLNIEPVPILGPFIRVEFNRPSWSSRDQMIELLKSYGWVPTEFTDKGNPQLTEESLIGVEGPVGKLLAERFRLGKRIAFIVGSPGKPHSGILNNVRADGRVAAGINVGGAVTGRCTHRLVTSVPRPTSPYGPECRAIFIAPPGRLLVDPDADALEARCMAHYMNDDVFTKRVVEGRKEDGTDIHTANAVILGLVPAKQYTFFGVEDSGRGHAKRFLYAMIYGAGDEKLGRILGGDKQYGAMMRGRFLTGLPKYANLLERVERKVCILKKNGESTGQLKEDAHLLGLDGRKIPIRSVHAAVNSLFQGAGATIVDVTLLKWDVRITQAKLDALQVGYYHDEALRDCLPEHAEPAGKLFLSSLTFAERFLKVRCPITGSYQIGQSWATTH